MVSNVLVEQVVTRFLRFHPKTWIGAIAMKVEVVAEPGKIPTVHLFILSGLKM